MAWQAIAAIAQQGVSSFLGGMGALQERKNALDLAKTQQAIADAQASDALLRGGYEAGLKRMATRRLIGSQRAAYGTSGVDVQSGSAGDVYAQTEMIGELDALMIKNNARREAWGYQVQSIEAQLRGKQAAQSATMAFVGSVLGGGMSIGKTFAQNYSAPKKEA